VRDRALPWLVAFATGALFSLGLALSGMTDPAKVLGFLDVTGAWDPALLFVMAGGVAVFAAAWQVARRMRAPLVAGARFAELPRELDGKLVAGALLFGAGWGLAGYCPAPALAAVGAGVEGAAVFAAAMVAGMLLHQVSAR
jgi:uncharacterized protein